jgi:DNA-binding CsgD family transcriptional regulator
VRQSEAGRRSSPPTLLLEREAEVAALEALLNATRGGDGRLVVIEGSAGIGKTRLLSEARQLARAAEFEVLTARGGELEGEFAFGVVRQLFEAPLAVAVPDARAELLGGAAGLSASLFASAAVSGDGAESSFAKLHGLYWLAANFALRNPTLLVVDDLHWADEPSLRWLVYLAHRIEGLPLLLLVATRRAGQASAPSLVAELVGDSAAVAIRPRSLGPVSVATLASRRLEAEPDPDFTAALQSASGGKLFLVALLDALSREGIAPTSDRSPHVLELGPQAVSRGVATRLARLPPDATALLRAAATLGDRTELSLAATLAELEPGVALSAASALVRADLLAHENPLEFTHPVVRTAVLEEMGAEERTQAQRRAGEILLERGELPEQAATYLVRTVPAADPFVVTTLRQAAARSVAKGAAEAAVAYLRRALGEPPAAAERLEVLFELGVAELKTGLAADALEHLRRAVAELEAVTGRPEIVLAYAYAIALLGSQKESLELMQSTSDGIRDRNRDLHSRIEARLITAAQFEPELYPIVEDRLALVRAEELAGGVGAGMLLATSASQQARRGVARAEAIGLAERALSSGAFDEADELVFFVAAPFTLTLAGNFDAASEAFALAIAAARRQGNLLNLAALPLYRGFLRLQLGELLAAEEDIRPFDDEVFEDMPTFRAYRAGFLADLLLERGEIAAAEALIAGRIEDVPPGHTLHFLLTRARTRLESGHPEQAARDCFAVGSIADSLGIENPAFYAWWRSQAALALRQLGRADEARQLASEELDRSRRWGAERAIGVSLRALGLVEGGRSGEQLLREAVDVLAGSQARLEHTRALVDLGAALRRGNSRSEARELLREGIELAHRCGATALVERGNDELAATGAHRRTVLLSGLDELTASERRVAQLAAEDLSNKEIAQALYVTVKTVEQHLGRVYRKLDISSRKQLPAALCGRAESPAPV